MKNMKLQKLWLLSHRERRARVEVFDAKTTVVLGENDVGKSHLLKSIYAVFGANAAAINKRWTDAAVTIAASFSINTTNYTIIKFENLFGLFDANGSIIWSGTSILTEVGPRIASLLGFDINLTDRNNRLIVPPPQFCFLPFYQDQDSGWNNYWSSFKSVGMLSGYKQSLLEYHTGLRPSEYYTARAAKDEALRQLADLVAERRALDRAATRLQAGRARPSVPFEPERFALEIDQLVVEANELSSQLEDFRKVTAELQSERATIIHQIEIATNTLNELDADFVFLKGISQNSVTCPTCHAIYDNDFASRFGLLDDAENCRQFLKEARQSLDIVERKITLNQEKMNSHQHQIDKINEILATRRGWVTLKDMLKDESDRLVQSTILEEQLLIDQARSNWAMKQLQAEDEIKNIDDKERKSNINKFYQQKLRQFSGELGVSFRKSVYKSISPSISETGSYGTRAFLAYYFAILHTIQEFSSSFLAPIVLDTPLQQEQDADNAVTILKFIRDRRPQQMQLILGTVSLHGVTYLGTKIEPSAPLRLLQEDQYGEVARSLAPLIDQMLRDQYGGDVLL